jgi:hypothetical protein
LIKSAQTSSDNNLEFHQKGWLNNFWLRHTLPNNRGNIMTFQAWLAIGAASTLVASARPLQRTLSLQARSIQQELPEEILHSGTLSGFDGCHDKLKR